MTNPPTYSWTPRPNRLLPKLIVNNVAVMALFAVAAPLSNADACADYHHPPQTLTTAEQNYKNSVVHIEARFEERLPKEGTAFLIDAEDGLFLTAHHVVRGATKIIGTFDEEGYPSLMLTVDKVDDELDVALLKTTESSILAGRPSFDFSFSHQSSHQEVAFFGASYTNKDAETNEIFANIKLSLPATQFDYSSKNELIEIMTFVDDGDSGAPVIKADDGLVVAIVLKKMTTRMAVARISVDLIPFLGAYAFGDTSDGPEPVTEDALQSALLAKPMAMSNLRLAHMIRSLWEQDPRPAVPQQIKGCDVYTAADNRELGVFAFQLNYMAVAPLNNRLAGKAAMEEADDQFAFGYERDAQGLYRLAAKSFATEIAERLTGENGSGYVTALMEGSGYTRTDSTDVDDWFSAFGLPTTVSYDAKTYASKFVSPFVDDQELAKMSERWSVFGVPSKRKEDTMAALFHDYQTALVRAANLSPTKVAPNYWGNALVAATWGELLSDSDAHRALNYQAMGDAFFHLGRFEDAAKSYSSAWHSGLQTPLTLENYRYTSSRAKNRLIGDGTDLFEMVNVAPTFYSEKLYSLFEDIEVSSATAAGGFVSGF